MSQLRTRLSGSWTGSCAKACNQLKNKAVFKAQWDDGRQSRLERKKQKTSKLKEQLKRNNHWILNIRYTEEYYGNQSVFIELKTADARPWSTMVTTTALAVVKSRTIDPQLIQATNIQINNWPSKQLKGCSVKGGFEREWITWRGAAWAVKILHNNNEHWTICFGPVHTTFWIIDYFEKI